VRYRYHEKRTGNRKAKKAQQIIKRKTEIPAKTE
jgi:hypothetical protein